MDKHLKIIKFRYQFICLKSDFCTHIFALSRSLSLRPDTSSHTICWVLWNLISSPACFHPLLVHPLNSKRASPRNPEIPNWHILGLNHRPLLSQNFKKLYWPPHGPDQVSVPRSPYFTLWFEAQWPMFLEGG